MKYSDCIYLINDKDFHLDRHGRIVVDNEEILAIVNGAINAPCDFTDVLDNTGCVNGCC